MTLTDFIQLKNVLINVTIEYITNVLFVIFSQLITNAYNKVWKYGYINNTNLPNEIPSQQHLLHFASDFQWSVINKFHWYENKRLEAIALGQNLQVCINFYFIYVSCLKWIQRIQVTDYLKCSHLSHMLFSSTMNNLHTTNKLTGYMLKFSGVRKQSNHLSFEWFSQSNKQNLCREQR